MAAPLTSTASSPRVARAKLVELLPFAVLALWSLAIVVLLARHGVHNHYVFRDEVNAILFGRDIARDSSLALTGGVARGPERLTSFLAAGAALATDSPTRQLELLHLSSALFQGLVTVPVWLAARQLCLSRWQSLVPATIASTGSFAFYGILTLHTSVALLCSMGMLWAMLRTLRRPGVVSDLLVIGTLALTVLARIGWAPLLAALVPAALAVTWFSRPQGEVAKAWLRRLPGRLLHRHPLLLPIAVLLLLVAVVAGPSLLLGGQLYGGVRLKPQFHLPLLWDNTRTLAAHLAIGTAIVPLVLALPVLVRGLVRPTDAVEGGFAWLMLGIAIVFSYAYYASMNEDRYFAVLAPPLILAGTLAVVRRPPPVWSVLVSGGVVAALVATSYSWPFVGVFGYFIAPTSQFFQNIPIGKLAPHLPGDDAAIAAFVAVVACLAAAFVVYAARHRALLGRAGVAATALVLLGVLAFQVEAMDHPVRKFTEASGMETLTADQLEFIDRVAHGGVVRPLAIDGDVGPELAAQMQFAQAFNPSVTGPYFVNIGNDPNLPPSDVTVDWHSGRAAVSTPPPAMLLQIAGAARIGFAGTATLPSQLFPWAQLVRLDDPLRVSWISRGGQVDRYPLRGTPIEVRVFPTGAPNSCLTGEIFAYPTLAGGLSYRLSGGKRPLEGTIRPLKPRSFEIPIEGARPRTFRLSGEAGRPSDGIWRGPTLFNVNVARCTR